MFAISEDIRLMCRRVFIYDYPEGLKVLAKRSGVNYYRLYNFCNFSQAEYYEKARILGERPHYLPLHELNKGLLVCGYKIEYFITPIGEITP